MVRRPLRREYGQDSRWLLRCMVLCAAWCVSSPGYAEAPTAAHELSQAKTALERARFDEAEARLSALLARADLSPKERNDTLELTAIVLIAERKETKARTALKALLQRDPSHQRSVADPGPAVDRAFAQALQTVEKAPEIALTLALERDPTARLVLRVVAGDGSDAVDSVHVFVETESDGSTTHLVSPAWGREALAFLLPPPLPGTEQLRLHLTAHAPSGAVIGNLGTADTPVYAAIPPPTTPSPACVAEVKPLRREWWVWTTVGIVVSGIVVASAVTAN